MAAAWGSSTAGMVAGSCPPLSPARTGSGPPVAAGHTIQKVRRTASSLGFAVALVVSLAAMPALAGPASSAPRSGVQTADPATTGAPLPPPVASVLVDADTGAVVSGMNDRTPLLVASTSKIITALVVRDQLADDALVPVSPLAAGMPARKLTLLAGERWRAIDLLHAMLLCSCNDAAVALAEAAGGSIEGFGKLLAAKAAQLGMADRPVLADPSGLDDGSSIGGGNLISARDLAIATRAFLRDPVLAGIVVMSEYRFEGGDGEPHRVVNHNRLLQTYTGAIGVKTGFTERSGASLVAAARRDGRTMIAVVLRSPNTYVQAAELLDRGFATPRPAQEGLPRLAPEDRAEPGGSDRSVRSSAAADPGNAADSDQPTTAGPGVAGRGEGDGDGVHPATVVAGGLAFGVAAVGLRRRQVVRRQEAAARARRRGPPPQRVPAAR